MKQLFIVLALVLSTTSYSQRAHNILRKYKNNDDVIAMKYDNDVLDMFKSKEDTLRSEIDFVDIIMFAEGNDIKDKDATKLSKALKKENYELLINAKNKMGKMKLMGTEKNQLIDQLFAHVVSEYGNIYFVMKGKIYFDELQKLKLQNIGKLGGINIEN